ncbi:hypothetical protein PI124_g4479 [Phytophthora idaei]|nr:hypothetical protein PI126_g3832 [Phytophthora idaei]KAG3250898.1 hypothetical protein PI124_g4479 [Phytophthora idaei]
MFFKAKNSDKAEADEVFSLLWCSVSNGVFGVATDESFHGGILKRLIVDEVNLNEIKKPIPCSPTKLVLYLAKDDGGWLRGSDEIVADLCRGEIPDRVEVMTKGDGICASQLISVAFNESPPGCISILAKVADCQMETWNSTLWAEHSYDPSLQYLQLNSTNTYNSGLQAQRPILYCRPNFHEQFRFMREQVCDEGRPPGTGKSSTSMVFASTIDRN